jgi:hypothetical protein
VDDTPPPDQYDSEDLAALDFYGSDDDTEGSDLDALVGYGVDAVAADDEVPALDQLGEGTPGEGDEPAVPTFTVTNPPGTVTVSTFIDGRIQRIELMPEVRAMTEAHLAEEIVVIAGLATQDARAAQFAFMLEGMRAQGHDEVATRDFLTRDLDLPSPEDATSARAQLFSMRYAGDHD